MKKQKNIVSKIIVSTALTATLMMTSVFGVSASPTVPTFEPQDIILTIGSDSSSLNLNWFCDNDGEIETPSVKVDGISTVFTGTQVYDGTYVDKEYNKVTVTGLQPSKTYRCQVSSDGENYSATYKFKTVDYGKYTFAVVGDPQIGCLNPKDSDASIAADTISWSNTVDEILGKGASFIVGTGDQIENSGQNEAGIAAKVKEYAGLSEGLLQGTQLVPFAACIGNHEGDGGSASGAGRDLFDYYYNIPMVSTDIVSGFKLIDYYYMYNNTLYVVLDDAAYPADTASSEPFIAAYDDTLAAAVEENAGKYDWLVVTTHKSQESDASHWNDNDINAYSLAGFEDLMTKYDVDLVLTGHDHSYVRTYPFKSNYSEVGTGGSLVTDGITIDQNNLGDDLLNPYGTVYMSLNSSTGSKYYGLHNPEKDTTKVENQDYEPQYTIITVKHRFMTVTTYEVGETAPIDSFTIQKNNSTNSNN